MKNNFIVNSKLFKETSDVVGNKSPKKNLNTNTKTQYLKQENHLFFRQASKFGRFEK